MGKLDKKNQTTYIILILVAVCFYLIKYLSYSALPEVSAKYPLGWWGWWDQGQYIKSARALANFDFKGDSHWYPIGYPLMGALFYKLVPVHPFLIPNILYYVGIVWLFSLISNKFLTKCESTILAFFAFFVDKIVVESLVIPWTTIPTHFFIYAIIYLLVFHEESIKRYALAAVFTGIIFLCRNGDMLFIAPLFLFSMLATREIKKIFTYGFVSFFVFLPFLLFTLISNKYIFGVYWETPYYEAASINGFSLYNIFYKAYSVFIEAGTLYSLSTPMLLKRYTWMLLIIPGTFYAYKKYGLKIVGVILSIIATYIFYLTYNDFDSQNIFKYKIVHYLRWTLPLLLLFAYLTVRHAWLDMSWKRITLLTLPFIAFSLLVSLEVKEIDWSGKAVFKREAGKNIKNNVNIDWSLNYNGEDGKILKVDFDSPMLFNAVFVRGWLDKRWPDASLILSIDGKRLINITQYRTILRDDGVILLFHKKTIAKSMEIEVSNDYRGIVSISEIRLLKLRFGFGGRIADALDKYKIFHQVSAVKVGEVEDLTGPSDKCDISDGKRDQGVRLTITPELGAKVSTLELTSIGKTTGRWVSCYGPSGFWKIKVIKEGLGKAADLSSGGRFIIHFTDNGAIADKSVLQLKGLDNHGEEVFKVKVKN